jgi:hypothetical protein
VQQNDNKDARYMVKKTTNKNKSPITLPQNWNTNMYIIRPGNHVETMNAQLGYQTRFLPTTPTISAAAAAAAAIQYNDCPIACMGTTRR